MNIHSIHRKGKTITILPKIYPIGLASEAHASCKLYLLTPHAHVYGESTICHTIYEEDINESN